MNDLPSSSDKTNSKDIDNESIVELSVIAESEDTKGKDGTIELTDVVPEKDDVIELTDVVTTEINAPKAEDHAEPGVDTGETALYADDSEPERQEPSEIEAAASTSNIDEGEAAFENTAFPGENLEATPGIETPQADVDTGPDVDTEEPVLYFDESKPERRETGEAGADVSTSDIGEQEAAFDDMAFADEDLETPEGEHSDATAMNLEAGIMPPTEDSEELDFSLTTSQLSEAIGQMDTGDAQEPSTEPETSAGLNVEQTVRPEMIESAVEKVVRERFTEKIDQLIEAAIERTVTAEIDRLKKRLLGDGD